MKRLQARWRSRRIILNNDGNDLMGKPGPINADSFLAARTVGLEDSQVDSIFYCDGVFNMYSHCSEESEFMNAAFKGGAWCHSLREQGHEPLRLIGSWCRANQREFFWSLRMNDQHDSHIPELLAEWKKEHKDWLMNLEGWEYHPPWSWSMVNYGIEGVRDKVFRIAEDVLTRYDVDGIELDFFRHPCFFRDQMEGRPASAEQLALMTGLIRRIRECCDRVAEQWGHPVLLAIRIPDCTQYCRSIGLDIEDWLREELVDLVIGGGYFKLRPWTELVALGKQHNVPVYACFTPRRVNGGGTPLAGTDVDKWRGEALVAWRAGVNGIYSYNRFDPHDSIFRELGNPAVLESLPHTIQESFAGDEDSRYLNPGYWLKGGRQFLAIEEVVGA